MQSISYLCHLYWKTNVYRKAEQDSLPMNVRDVFKVYSRASVVGLERQTKQSGNNNQANGKTKRDTGICEHGSRKHKPKKRETLSRKPGKGNQTTGKHEPNNRETQTGKPGNTNQITGKHKPEHREMRTQQPGSTNRTNGKHPAENRGRHTKQPGNNNQVTGKHSPDNREMHTHNNREAQTETLVITNRTVGKREPNN